jgi:hypothetical protein
MKSVPNLISYRHEFFWIFSQFIDIYFELFSFGGIFNSENADELVPTAPRRRRCPNYLASPRPDHAIAAVQSRAAAVSESRRCLAVRRHRELRPR